MKKVLLVATIAAALVTVPAYANQGYLGVTLGSTEVDEPEFEDDRGYKLTLGAKINEGLAFEGSIVNLGTFNIKDEYLLPGASASVEVDGLEIALVGNLATADALSVTGTIGYLMWDTKSKVSYLGGSASESDNGSDIFFGLGLDYSVSENVSLKGGLTWYELDNTDGKMFSAGINFNF